MDKFTFYLLLCSAVSFSVVSGKVHTEEDLKQFLYSTFERNASLMCTESVMATWNYEADLTEANSKKVTQVTLKSAAIDKELYEEWFKDVKLEDIQDGDVKRMLKDLKIIGAAVLSDTELTTLTETNSQMVNIYSTAKICPFTKQNCNMNTDGLNLEPEIQEILSSSTDYDELTYVWKSWRDASGKKTRDLYKTYVELNNKMAKANNFSDYGAYWRESFETEDFVNDLDKIWNQIAPLYKQLHNYTMYKLKEHYPGKFDTSDGLLPAHIFGNMWAQSWINLDKLLKPYPTESAVDITQALVEKGYTVHKIFETANEFYMSLGLPTNEVSYGPKSVIERPKNKEMLCHASAWDFCNKKDFLIKMCTEINQEDFVTVHHEMGHIQYYILYKDQPYKFREGANPGFHEAVGDTMALSVQSIKHLKAIELLDEKFKETKEAGINTLMSMALEKIAFMPFGYLIDKWRWDVFSGTVPETEWNKHWWDLRAKYQLVKAPVERTEEDFDPGAKFHIAGDSQYISYFVSHILQFQFYRGLCIAAGEYNPETKDPPLHKCDFYKNKAAGDKIKEALSLGSSKPWPYVLKLIAGTDKLDANALLEYFEPLSKFFDHSGKKGSGWSVKPSNIIIIATCAFYLLC